MLLWLADQRRSLFARAAGVPAAFSVCVPGTDTSSAPSTSGQPAYNGVCAAPAELRGHPPVPSRRLWFAPCSPAVGRSWGGASSSFSVLPCAQQYNRRVVCDERVIVRTFRNVACRISLTPSCSHSSGPWSEDRTGGLGSSAVPEDSACSARGEELAFTGARAESVDELSRPSTASTLMYP